MAFSSAAWAHPELEVELADGPSPGRSIGLDDMARFLREPAQRLGGRTSTSR